MKFLVTVTGEAAEDEDVRTLVEEALYHGAEHFDIYGTFKVEEVEDGD